MGARYQLEESQSQRKLGDDMLYTIFSILKVKATSQVLYVIYGIKAGVKPAHLWPLGWNSRKMDPWTRPTCIIKTYDRDHLERFQVNGTLASDEYLHAHSINRWIDELNNIINFTLHKNYTSSTLREFINYCWILEIKKYRTLTWELNQVHRYIHNTGTHRE